MPIPPPEIDNLCSNWLSKQLAPDSNAYEAERALERTACAAQLASLQEKYAHTSPAEYWGSWLDDTSPEELELVLALRPDLKARLVAVLERASGKSS